MQPEIHVPVPISKYQWRTSFWQIVRFSIVGILNTSIDILIFNILLLRFPTHSANLLLLYNSIAYTFGALNSFALNKYWTFKHKQVITGSELLRFAFVNIVGILCNDFIIWSVASILHPFVANSLLWANISKGCALVCTTTVSYFGMRLWVFTNKGISSLSPALADKEKRESVAPPAMISNDIHKIRSELNEPGVNINHSFSVIMLWKTFVRQLSSNWVLCAALFSISLSFNLYRLGNPSIWFDEAFSIELASQPFPLLWHIIFSLEPNMELYYLVLHAWLNLTALLGFHPTEFVVRLPSAVFSASSTVVVFLLGRRYLGLLVGLVAVELYLLNDLQLVYAQQARSFSLQLLLICLAWYAFLTAITGESHQKRWWLIFTITSTLAVYAHLFSLVILAAQLCVCGLLLLFPTPWRQKIKSQVPSLLLTLLTIGIFIIPLLLVSLQGPKTGWLPIPNLTSIARLFLIISGNNKIYLLALFTSCLTALIITIKAYLPEPPQKPVGAGVAGLGGVDACVALVPEHPPVGAGVAGLAGEDACVAPVPEHPPTPVGAGVVGTWGGDACVAHSPHHPLWRTISNSITRIIPPTRSSYHTHQSPLGAAPSYSRVDPCGQPGPPCAQPTNLCAQPGPPCAQPSHPYVAHRTTPPLPIILSLVCWLAIPIALSYLVSQGPIRLYSTRYLVTIVPPLLLLAGLGITSLRWYPARLALAAGLCLLALFVVPQYYTSAQVEDWNNISFWIEQHYQSGDGLVCYDNAVEQGCQISVEYYLHAYPGAAHFTEDTPGNFSWTTFSSRNPDAAVDPATLAAYSKKHPNVFFIVGRLPDDISAAQAQYAQNWLDTHYHLLAQIVTPTVTVRLYATHPTLLYSQHT